MFVGKLDLNMPNMVVSTVQGKKPKYKGDVNELNRTEKGQMRKLFCEPFNEGYIQLRKRRGKVWSGCERRERFS